MMTMESIMKPIADLTQTQQNDLRDDLRAPLKRAAEARTEIHQIIERHDTDPAYAAIIHKLVLAQLSLREAVQSLEEMRAAQ